MKKGSGSFGGKKMVSSFFKKLFGGSKQRNGEDVGKYVAKLMVELTPLYQKAIQKYLDESKVELVSGAMVNGALTMDLSPAGIEHLASNLPPSFTSSLHSKPTEFLQYALSIVESLHDKPSGGLAFNPSVLSLLQKAIEGEIQQRN
jgi:hypothetical protein